MKTYLLYTLLQRNEFGGGFPPGPEWVEEGFSSTDPVKVTEHILKYHVPYKLAFDKRNYRVMVEVRSVPEYVTIDEHLTKFKSSMTLKKAYLKKREGLY